MELDEPFSGERRCDSGIQDNKERLRKPEGNKLRGTKVYRKILLLSLGHTSHDIDRVIHRRDMNEIQLINNNRNQR